MKSDTSLNLDMSMTCNHNSRSDSPANSIKQNHSSADILEQTVCSRNLQNALTSNDNWDVQSETSTSTLNNQQLNTNADTFNFLPTGTVCGQIEISDSSGNHIGTKIVASTLTVINNNTSTTNPPIKRNESTTIQTRSILKMSHCSKLITLSSIIIIGFTVIKFYAYHTSNDKKRQTLPTSKVTEMPILTTTMEPKLPEPWLITRAQWGAVIPQTTCYGYTHANCIAIGDTKTNTCKSISACSKIIREIQSNKMKNLNESKCDIDYNFLIGYDSRIYEGIAWNATKLFEFYSVVKIAFIGDYSSIGRNDTLTDTQIFSLLKFLEKSENEKRFNKHYSITTECCSDKVKSPGENILVSMISWNTSNLGFKCIANNEYKSCNHLHYYYTLYHLDKYKPDNNH